MRRLAAKKQSDGNSLTAESSERSTLNRTVADVVATTEGAEMLASKLRLRPSHSRIAGNRHLNAVVTESNSSLQNAGGVDAVLSV
jgi:hypothetical protein